jgi:hypothetical protein
MTTENVGLYVVQKNAQDDKNTELHRRTIFPQPMGDVLVFFLQYYEKITNLTMTR